MAILWSETIDGNHYEVRTAGASLRLYRNGVHHSQYNAHRPLTGGIWDLLAVTTLYRRPENVNRALILGFGAGAAGRLLQELVAPEHTIGIELDPIHLSIADSFFECSQGCELIAADAVDWMYQTAPRSRATFDWILDDLYGEIDGLPVRCGPSDQRWFETLASQLAPGGMLVVNLVEPDEIEELSLLTSPKLKQRFPYIQQLSLKAYDNRILACSDQPFQTAVWRANVARIYQAFPACRGVADKYGRKALRRPTA